MTRLPFDELLKQIPKHTPPEEPRDVWERRIAEGQKLLEEAANNPPKPCPTCGEDEAYCDCEEDKAYEEAEPIPMTREEIDAIVAKVTGTTRED